MTEPPIDETMQITEDTVYMYLPDMNLEGAAIPGVPLRHVTQAEWDALPAYLQQSVADSPFYRRVPSPTTPDDSTSAHGEEG